MTRCKIFYPIIILFINNPIKISPTFFAPPSCSCPQQTPCSNNCQLPSQASYCGDFCRSNFYSNQDCPTPECPPCDRPQNCECPISNCPVANCECPVSNCPEQQQNCECNCPAPRECQPPPKAEYCGSYCPKVQSYGRTDGDPQIAYPAGSVGAQNQGYVSGVVEGGAPEYINPGGPRPPELLSVAPAPAGGAYTQGAGMTLQMSMTKSTGSGGSYSDKVITEDSNLPQIDNKFVVTTVATTTTTPAPTTIDTYDEIVPTSEDLALEIEELNNETNALPTVKYTLPPSVTDEVSLTEDEVPNSSDLNVISVGSLDNTVQSENSTNSTIKLFNPDPLLDYNDNDLAADFNLKLKSKRLAGVKNVINKNPKCSHKLLRKLMKEVTYNSNLVLTRILL